jgi:GxxExxY protein
MATFHDRSSAVIGACIEVHRHLGPGLLESVYEQCLARELTLRRIQFERQVLLPIEYKGVLLNNAYRADFIVETRLVLEVKAVEHLLPVHEAQMLTYLRVSGMQTGLLVNFHVPTLRNGGLRRLTRT